jgi:hypothetical protein
MSLSGQATRGIYFRRIDIPGRSLVASLLGMTAEDRRIDSGARSSVATLLRMTR